MFGQPGYFRGRRGVTITVVLVLILANAFDLSAIASLGSAVSLVVFLVVGVAGLRLAVGVGLEDLGDRRDDVRDVDRARPVRDRYRANAPQTFAAMLVLVALAVVLDTAWKRARPPALAYR